MYIVNSIYIVTRGWFKTVHFEAEGEKKKERDDRKKNNKKSRIFSLTLTAEGC